jgi:hypothetical protein
VKSAWDDLVQEFTPRPPARQAWWGFVAIVALVCALLLSLHFMARAYAVAPRVVWDCHQFSTWARRIAMLRELGADQGKVIGELRRELRPGITLAVLEHEVKRIYAGKIPRLEAEGNAYKRCQQQLGDMEAEG